MVSVIIVGAGVVGLFCATRLARSGVRVTVLESEAEDLTPYAPTASLAAAGMIGPLSDAEAGLETLALQSFDLWKRLKTDTPWEDGISFNGAAVICANAEAAAALEAKAKGFGRKAQVLSQAAWRKRTNLDSPIEHSVFVDDEGVADPMRVLSGLVMEARRYGAQIRYDQEVEVLTPTSATAYGGAVFEADRIILAPGVWANESLMTAAPVLRQIRPAKGTMVQAKTSRPLATTIHGPNFYVTPRLHDVVLGASMEFDRYDRGVEMVQVANLLHMAQAKLGNDVAVEGSSWAGIRPMSPDGVPIVGESGEALVACGHSRNGWLFAPITAEIMCAHVLGEQLDPAWAPFSPARFA